MKLAEAIILAAGMGTRLRGLVDDRPKGLIAIDGQPLVGRSIALMRGAGIERITIVAGYRSDDYQQFAAGAADLRILVNDAFASTGSMASLAIALRATPDADVLIVESDIVYEARALSVIAAAPANATLISGPTGAGDEVWVHAPGGCLEAMSKHAAELVSVDGELVGITRLSADASASIVDAFDRFVAAHGNGRMDYETGGLVEIAAAHPIATPFVADLCWGEIDDDRHYARIVNQVWPALTAR
jgi:2-aminoethylphosphonate-pyruvate transaminase